MSAKNRRELELPKWESQLNASCFVRTSAAELAGLTMEQRTAFMGGVGELMALAAASPKTPEAPQEEK
jgi:hypothetical protein